MKNLHEINKEQIGFDILNPPHKNKLIEMDKCVICGCETIYPKNMHIDYRYNYVEGAGQLCIECSKKI